jgi:HD-like signal output (HDOD) protein
MAQQLPVEYPEGAFVAGLFHDIGRLLIALGLPAEFERVLDRYHHTDHPWVACEQEVLGFTHAELSADALAVWELPEPIQRAARDHHAQVPFQLGATHPCATPGATRLGVTHSAATIPLSRVLDAANRYANSMGDAIILHQKNDASGAAWIESFGLAHEVVDRLVADYDAEHKAMAQFFS